ncbi:hypothetical protein [Nonomuraea insulae]|uniref:1,4-dihydroxy-2-naphthoate octaprenyltransferase n=1 Tax=Nonomuraea insulae TaxID=1616787 RepID=A0ABW1DD52_9ACTN
MADLDLLQAWAMWFDNVQVNEHTLYGWSILALGRTGKVMAFFGGMTVVLDLVGPERLNKFGERHKRFDPDRSKAYTIFLNVIVVGVLPLALFTLVMFWFAALGMVGIWGFFPVLIMFPISNILMSDSFPRRAIRGVARGLSSKRWEPVIRWGAVMLLFAGFHFDMLAS